MIKQIDKRRKRGSSLVIFSVSRSTDAKKLEALLVEG
ncbi:hypothetical protein MOE62_17375, partial [Bacillus inaquosorum]|nr:hypothetical protein [Bacillus inaquosorum]